MIPLLTHPGFRRTVPLNRSRLGSFIVSHKRNGDSNIYVRTLYVYTHIYSYWNIFHKIHRSNVNMIVIIANLHKCSTRRFILRCRFTDMSMHIFLFYYCVWNNFILCTFLKHICLDYIGSDHIDHMEGPIRELSTATAISKTDHT